MKYLQVAALLAFALPAFADFVVVEETETMTVYREGDQVIVSLDDAKSGDLVALMKERGSEVPIGTPIRDDAAKDAGVKTYFSRIRLLDAELVCEKVAARPLPEHREYVISVLSALPCRTGLL